MATRSRNSPRRREAAKKSAADERPAIFLEWAAPDSQGTVAMLTAELDQSGRLVAFKVESINDQLQTQAAMAAWNLALRSSAISSEIPALAREVGP
jgi:hypothetical protein